MRQIDVNEQIEEIEFAKRAANFFEKSDHHYSFTDGDVEQGCKIALRWGLGRDCVLVIKLDEFFEPIIYKQLVK